jgi:predicted TIM-barrel fold metal-dependent hydrolase
MGLLPDPPRQARRFPVISVDDHLIEPPDLFDGRLPASFGENAPRVVEAESGDQAWLFEGKRYPNVGLNAVVGRPPGEWSMEPARFDEMRKGCWDIHARVADMDTAGIWASLCFPSLIAGFAGVVFSKARDQALGAACVRAWNDWHHEVWAGTYPERIIPLQITWLADPALGAEEVRRNAERGFKALSFPENPANIGLPSVHTDHWDPILRACEETGTVVCLHTGSAAWTAAQSPGAPLELYTTLFPVNGIAAAADWLWARIPLRFPNLDVAFSEGGIGWVPMLLDRLDYGAAELLVLHDRRPLDPPGPPPHRGRPHHGGGRLPARRLELAGHPGDAGPAVRGPARRRGGDDDARQCGPVVPAPAAPGGVVRCLIWSCGAARW